MYLQDGKILPSPIPNPTAEIICSIPFSIWGMRIPDHQIKRLPSILINQSSLDIYFNRFAFTTSGNCDFSEIDSKGMSTQQTRIYNVQSASVILDFFTYDLSDYYRETLLNMMPSF